ncbi:hypothetical protein [Amycolatopsis sp.]|uniref:hypothetical protein n=1 Tax=Amycolatopsis sp. TaxID=37632 RepID=UPI002C5C48A0|nr:hypothetical protein [Amycolatopsis sp.]HVV10358.1 hypothetical protein [Amycolatopsis sp.]
MSLAQQNLQAYDEQLRGDGETPSALSVTRLGPLRLVTLPGGRGFATYRDRGDADAGTTAGWVEQAPAHDRGEQSIGKVKWKSSGHDHAPGLHEALVRDGFERGEAESVMIGEAGPPAAEVSLPDGVGLRQVTAEAGGRVVRRRVGWRDAARVAPVTAPAGVARDKPGLRAGLSEMDGMERPRR